MNSAIIENLYRWSLESIQSAHEADGAFDHNRYQELLTRAGVARGEAVVLAIPTGHTFLRAVIATLQAGALPVFVPPGLGAARVAEITIASQAKAALTLNHQAAAGAARRYSNGMHALTISDGEVRRYHPGELILTTSGTSGVNSGCLFNLERLLFNARMHLEAVPLTPDDRLLVCLPVCFSYAFVAQVLAAFLANAKVFISAPPFSANFFARDAQQRQITATSLTPYLVRRLVNAGIEMPSTLRLITVGGDTLAAPFTRWLMQTWPGKELYLTYGLTEAGPRVSTLAAHAEPPAKWHTVGRPLRGVKTLIRDKEEDGCGGLMVQTPTSMLERVGTVEGFDGAGAASGSWIDTGDVFFEDDDGYLAFIGRAKEFVVINGEKICLSSVRRIAQENVFVSRAATQVIKNGDEVLSYRLLLHLNPLVSPDQLDVQSIMKKMRQAERPTEVVVVEVDHEHKYK
jgi:acyl-CoA synthetase (AMP-forming)/AMP-acid ligase II